jgi:hypothetical protein
MDSTLSTYISSYVNNSLNSYDISTQSSITSILGNLCTISTVAVSTSKIAISTANAFAGQIQNLSIQTAQNTSTITNLNFSLFLLTTSSLISSIYFSFLGLEQFCCTLVQSTNNALTTTLNSTTQAYVSSIYSTIISLGTTSLGSATPRTFIKRIQDNRNSIDTLYRVRYVIPSNSEITARPPTEGLSFKNPALQLDLLLEKYKLILEMDQLEM